MTSVTLGQPAFLWLLIVPAALLTLGVWRFVRRQIDARRLRATRSLPARQRLGLAGDLPMWLCATLAAAALIVAMARPQAPASTPRRAGIDVILLQDASASMRVADMGGATERWRRAMTFLRELGDALSWRDDRIALTVFARLATPQIRLTRDPNTFFFFLDHLQEKPPFRIEDDATWDTNLELGIDWGIRLLEKDEEIHGRSRNARVFVLLSDGEAWSGEVARAVSRALQKGIPIFVIGVGTLSGGRLPVVLGPDGRELEIEGPVVSRLDRASLQRIAAAGGGSYFELDRDGDPQIASSIIAAGRRLAPAIGSEEQGDELYWWLLVAAAVLIGVGLLFIRQRTELWLVLAGASAAAVVILRLVE